jgi:DNA (cytosine-5)-methyltransferase 1
MGGILHYSEFAGVGGTDDGAEAVDDVETIAAANHDPHAIASHALNFPNAEHFCEDLTKLDIDKMPWCHLFTASPACPAWTTANGLKRDFDRANAEPGLFVDLVKPVMSPQERKRRAEYKRSRLLMKEIPRYLRAWVQRGRPVPMGFLENVIQVRLWHEWDEYLRELWKLGYKTKVIAFNSMHARPRRSRKAPQSRNRAYVAFWHVSLGRDPDWDKWLRPKAWCGNCAQVVEAVQVWKKPDVDMGAYDTQYTYRCPALKCRGRRVYPEVVPALDAIDPTIVGARIDERADRKLKRLEFATLWRTAVGVSKFWAPLLVPVGGTWRGGRDGSGARPLGQVMPARTTRETDAVAVPPMMVPVEGRDGKLARPATEPTRTLTCRNETGLAELVPPFITPLRGGGDKGRARPASEPLPTVAAQGFHHGLAEMPTLVMRNTTARGSESRCTPVYEPMRTITAQGKQSVVSADSLLVPYNRTGVARPVGQEPMGTLTTHDRFGVATSTRELESMVDGLAAVGDLSHIDPKVDEAAAEKARTDLIRVLGPVRFRMLEIDEIRSAMGFPAGYRTSTTVKSINARLYGNAVTPCVAEILTSALVECLTGRSLERDLVLAA